MLTRGGRTRSNFFCVLSFAMTELLIGVGAVPVETGVARQKSRELKNAGTELWSPITALGNPGARGDVLAALLATPITDWRPTRRSYGPMGRVSRKHIFAAHEVSYGAICLYSATHSPEFARHATAFTRPPPAGAAAPFRGSRRSQKMRRATRSLPRRRPHRPAHRRPARAPARARRSIPCNA